MVTEPVPPSKYVTSRPPGPMIRFDRSATSTISLGSGGGAWAGSDTHSTASSSCGDSRSLSRDDAPPPPRVRDEQGGGGGGGGGVAGFLGGLFGRGKTGASGGGGSIREMMDALLGLGSGATSDGAGEEEEEGNGELPVPLLRLLEQCEYI